MKKRTKIIICIVVIVFALLLSFLVYDLLLSNKDKIVDIDLQTLNTNLYVSEQFEGITMEDIDINDLKEKFNIEEKEVSQFIGKTPVISIKSSMYVIVKTDINNVKNIKSKFQLFLDSYITQWENYLLEEYELTKNAKIDSKGEYVYLLISQDVEEIEKLI